MVNASEVLDIIEIVYYVPAILLSLYVVKKQGMSRELGWILITILCLCRLISSATGIAAVYNPTNRSLITASLITSATGSATLVAALTGIVNRINAGTGQKALPPRITRMLQLMTIVAIVLGILGGVKQAEISDPGSVANGRTYTKIAVIFIFLQFLASSFVAGHSLLNISHVMDGDRKLLFVALASLPFLLVRLIYSLCAAFQPGSSTFSGFSSTVTAVAVRACMAIAMEFVVVALLLFGGFVSPKWIKPAEADRSTSSEQYDQHEMYGKPTGYTSVPQSYQGQTQHYGVTRTAV